MNVVFLMHPVRQPQRHFTYFLLLLSVSFSPHHQALILVSHFPWGSIPGPLVGIINQRCSTVYAVVKWWRHRLFRASRRCFFFCLFFGVCMSVLWEDFLLRQYSAAATVTVARVIWPISKALHERILIFRQPHLYSSVRRTGLNDLACVNALATSLLIASDLS